MSGNLQNVAYSLTSLTIHVVQPDHTLFSFFPGPIHCALEVLGVLR